MRSLRKMAREKKVKVLLFVIFLFGTVSFRYARALEIPRLTHIIKDGSNGLEAVCIASEREAYSATDWTYPIEKEREKRPEIITYFLPNLTSEHFDCNFEKQQSCILNYKSRVWWIPEKNNKNFEPIFDYRWEDFEINGETKRVDIMNDFNVTLSVRSDHDAKIWLCEGWLPTKYNCYVVFLGSDDGKSVFLKNNKNKTLNNLANYTSENNIFSFDQWKSFQISFSNQKELKITDSMTNDVLINFIDKSPLKPIYLFVNSENPLLWKIHENGFLYTNISTETIFGPVINTTRVNLCVYMFIAMCGNCSITFYIENNGITNNIFQSNGSNITNWTHIKIHITNYTNDQIQLNTKTEGPEDGYWMIDNIRFCSRNEVKVTILKNSNSTNFNMTDEHISCHDLSTQQWRPKPYRMEAKIGLPETSIEKSNTSVTLSFKPQLIFEKTLPFVLQYQGHHLCQEGYILKNASILRIKSNDILLVDGKTIINNLIPYTHYTFSFASIIYGNFKKTFNVDTLELRNITEFERPRTLLTKTTDTTMETTFQPPSCNDLYGRLLYKYTIVGNEESTISQLTTFTKKSLHPFSNFTLKIEIGRDLDELRTNINKYVGYYNFSTKPSFAPPLDYLEVYETTKNSISVRYKPNFSGGIPYKIRTTYCMNLYKNKCQNSEENVTKCTQFPTFYCTTIKNLIKNQKYAIKLSILNNGTHIYGQQRLITAYTKSIAPGDVTNITYKAIDCSASHEYCNFNISWQHPWQQNGGITAFEIELTQVGSDKGLDDIYLIKDKQYQHRYWHVVKYLPYATTYDINIRAINELYKGNYTTIRGKIDHIGEHIDQIPEIVHVLPSQLVVKIPVLDERIESAILTVIVQNSKVQHIHEEMWKIAADNLCYEVAETWIAKVLEFSKSNEEVFIIGDDTIEFSDSYNRDIVNKELIPDSDYCLNYIVENTYRNITHKKVYHWQQKTAEKSVPRAEALSNGTIKVVMILLSLLVLVVIGALILYRYRHRIMRLRRVRHDGEHIYETMPFEEYNEESNVVYNQTYDKLIHN